MGAQLLDDEQTREGLLSVPLRRWPLRRGGRAADAAPRQGEGDEGRDLGGSERAEGAQAAERRVRRRARGTTKRIPERSESIEQVLLSIRARRRASGTRVIWSR